jgi:hypothetical protein
MMLPLSFMRGTAEFDSKESTVEVGVDDLLEDGFVGRASRRPARNACIGEDDVKFGKVFGEFSEELLAVLRHRHVSTIDVRFRSEFGDRFIQCLLIATRNCDFSAFREEKAGCARPMPLLPPVMSAFLPASFMIPPR